MCLSLWSKRVLKCMFIRVYESFKYVCISLLLYVCFSDVTETLFLNQRYYSSRVFAFFAIQRI